MKKFLGMALFIFMGHAVFAQSDTTKIQKKKQVQTQAPSDSAKAEKKKPTYASLNLANRANDHFMLEFSYDNWVGKTDSMNTTGFCRGFAFYFMFDFPFKTDPHFSVGAGLGIDASNIFFDKTEVLVAAPGNQTLAFPTRPVATILKNTNWCSLTWKYRWNSAMPSIRRIPTKAGK